jgi:hypothetical protein
VSVSRTFAFLSPFTPLEMMPRWLAIYTMRRRALRRGQVDPRIIPAEPDAPLEVLTG